MKVTIAVCAAMMGWLTLARTEAAVGGNDTIGVEPSTKASTFEIDPRDAKWCTDQAGVFSKTANGRAVCTIPPLVCRYGAAAYNSGIDINDPLAVSACLEACGHIVADKALGTICVPLQKPAR